MAACCMSMLRTLILTKRESVMEFTGKPTAGMYVIIVKYSSVSLLWTSEEW